MAAKTRLSLFGLSLRSVSQFEDRNEDDTDELFATTIERVRYLTGHDAQFTTAEGAVWEMKNIRRRLRRIEASDSVVFKGASMGYLFIRRPADGREKAVQSIDLPSLPRSLTTP